MSSTSFFCSNPDALGIDESVKGIFDSLKNIAPLPPSPPRVDDRLVDSAVDTAENPATGGTGGESPATGTGECLSIVD